MAQGARIQHEQLESRTLLSVTYAGRVLSVYGTAGNDVIAVALKNGRVAVFENGVQTASFATVRSILVEGGSGRDKIGIDSNITVKTKLVGGSGHDSIVGGGGPDVLYGNAGNDLLLGQAGVDALLGGADNDTLDGGEGDDYLDGQSDNDTVTYANRTSGIKATLEWDDVDDDESTFVTLGRGGTAGELDRYASVDTLISTAYDDRIGAICHIAVAEGTFPLLIDAGNGDDYLYTSTFPSNSTDFAPLIRGGDGNDTFSFISPSEATMLGEAGNDRLWHPTEFGSDDSIALFDGGASYDVQDVNCETDYACAYATYLAPNVEEAVIEAFTYTFRLTDGDDNVLLTVKDRGSYNPLRVEAKAGNDKVTINGEPTHVLGQAGNDTLIGGTGNDTLDGGTGLDVVTYAARTAPITAAITRYPEYEPTGRGGEAGEADEYISIEALHGGKGNDSLAAASFDFDKVIGDNFPTDDDFAVVPSYGEPISTNGTPGLFGGDGDDTFGFVSNAYHWPAYGEAGNDTFVIGADDDATYGAISGGPGTDLQDVRGGTGEYSYGLAADVENAYFGFVDKFIGNDSDNVLVGSAYLIDGKGGSDRIVVHSGSLLLGGDGNDRIDARTGDAALEIHGGNGNDVIYGTAFDDTIFGESGRDALFGLVGNDTLDGGDDNDYIEGNEGVDTILGNLGNLGDDAFYTRDRALDFIYGGDGTDTLKGDATEAVVDSVEVIA